MLTCDRVLTCYGVVIDNRRISCCAAFIQGVVGMGDFHANTLHLRHIATGLGCVPRDYVAAVRFFAQDKRGIAHNLLLQR